MKKYLSSILSATVAIGICAYNRPQIVYKHFSYNRYFIRVPPISSSVVSTLANWELETNLLSCPEGDQKACNIIVDERDSQVLTDPTTGFLYIAPSGITISSTSFDATTYKVSSVSTVSGHFPSYRENSKK